MLNLRLTKQHFGNALQVRDLPYEKYGARKLLQKEIVLNIIQKPIVGIAKAVTIQKSEVLKHYLLYLNHC